MTLKKKKKTREQKSTLKKEKWLIVAIFVAVLFSAVKLLEQQHYNFNTTTEKLPQLISPSETIIWSGNDPALSHKIGRETPDGGWTSTEGSFGYMTLGPHANLSKGAYKVSFELKIDGIVNGSYPIATIDMTWKNGQPFVSESLYGKDFENGEYKNLNIYFVSGEVMEDVEFRIYHSSGKENLTLRGIVLSSGKTKWAANDPELKHKVGREGPGDSWTSGDGGLGYMISSGPHISMAPGIYLVSYTFVIDGREVVDESKHVATIEFSRDSGLVFLTGELNGLDMKVDPSKPVVYKSIINKITAKNPLNNVEFKLFYPNSSVNVVLRDIILSIQ